MPDNFDQRLAAAAARLEQEASVRSPTAVRARGDQRRRRHAATMAVVPVAVLAIAGTVGLAVRPSGGSSRHDAVGPSPTQSASVSTSSATAPVIRVNLARHTLAILDPQGKVVRTLSMTAGGPTHPTQTGTFTVTDKVPTKTLSSPGDGAYDITVAFYISLGPNAPAIYAMPARQADFGKENATHGAIELGADDAERLYDKLAVGDTIQIVAA